MTYQYVKADRAAWERAIADLQAAETVKANMTGADRVTYEEVSDSYGHAKDAVLAQPAPDFPAVIAKLHLLFAEEIGSDLSIYEAHKIVIGDLRRLCECQG